MVLLFASLLACSGALAYGGLPHAGACSMPSAPASRPAAVAQPIVIRRGGSYSGVWRSDDQNVPAVTIATDQPVVLHDSVIFSRGPLIKVLPSGTGANVTVQDVSGTALDPQRAGVARGMFLSAERAARVTVAHCTMNGVSFGVYLADSTLQSLHIDHNIANDMEDRASDGAGGLLKQRPLLGHFIQLGRSSAPNGADISWNQVIDAYGQSSVEDIIDVYESHGSSAHPIDIHDNYLQGAFTTPGERYTGGGITSEGATDDLTKMSGFVRVTHNTVVQTGNYGIAIAAGHDIVMTDNRVVSCGRDSSGRWYAGPFGNASAIWNIRNATHFFNNHIGGTTGGLVRPDASGHPVIANAWAPETAAAAHNSLSGNFEGPCKNFSRPGEADQREWSSWKAKVAAAHQVLGDRHKP